MADTNFVPGTVVTSEWLNDTNAITYGLGSTASGKGAEMVAFKQSGTGAVDRTVSDKLREFVSVKDFGAVGDGVTDDTAAVTAAHVYANSIGAAVSYKGCNRIAIQANARVPVKTSVDFENCEVVILGGVAGSPGFPIPNIVFVVTDDACPLVTTTGAVSASNLTKGALFPTLGLFDGHGYALLECAFQVPNRAETGTVNYKQSFKINRNGRASQPLSTDISAHASAITVSYRRTSQKRLFISNLTLVEGTWNNQCVIDIQRCNVKVSGVSMLFNAPGSTFNNICAILRVTDASDVYIEDFVTTGRPVTASAGSYCLEVNGGSDIFVDRMNALTGWGATGCNNINGMYYNRCVLNRVDVHESAHNVFVDDCDIHEAGMVYGWGGGVFSIKNSRLHRCPAISSRPDYGNTFFGDFIVDGCEAESNTTSTYYVVDLLTNPIGASTAIYAPETITVQNFRRVGKASGSNAELVPVAIQIKDASSLVYAPSSIKVHNIGCHPSWRFGMRLDFLNMEGNPGTFNVTRIEFSEIFPNVTATTSTGIVDLTNIRTPSAAVQPIYLGNNCDNIRLLCRSSGGAEVYLNNMGLNGVEFNSGASTQPRCHIDHCRFFIPATGYANPSPLAPVGGTRTGNSNYTSISNSTFGASNVWNLANVSASFGVLITPGTQTPALPSGQTPTTMFTGFRAAGAFQS